MKNYLLAILFSLVIVPGFSQPKPSKKEKPPTAKEIEDMQKEMEKEMEKGMKEMSPEDKKMMDSMGFKMPSMPTLPKMTDKQIATAMEEANRIVPIRDEARIAKISKQPLATSAIPAYLNTVHGDIVKKLDPYTSESGEKIYQWAKKEYKGAAEAGNAAVGLWMMGKPKVAIYIMSRACKDDPTDADNLNNFSSLLTMAGGEQYAIPLLQNLNTKFPKNTTILNNLGQAWFGLGEIKLAEKYLDSCVKIYPAHSQANLTKSLILESRGDKANAIEALRKSIKEGYSHEKEDRLHKLGYDLKDHDVGWDKYMPSDPLGLERFKWPDYPMNVTECETLKPKWRKFVDDCQEEIAKLTVKQKELEQKMTLATQERTKNVLQAGYNGTMVNPFPQFAPKAFVKLKYLVDGRDGKLAYEYERQTEKLAREVTMAEELEGIYDKNLEVVRKRYDPLFGEGKENPMRAACTDENKVKNDFLAEANSLLRDTYRSFLNYMKRLLNDRMYYCQYTQWPDEFEFSKVQTELSWLNLIKDQKVYFLEKSAWCPPKEDTVATKSKDSVLSQFDDMHCQYHSESDFLLASIESNCSELSIKLDLHLIDKVLGVDVIKIEGSFKQGDKDGLSIIDQWQTARVEFGPKKTWGYGYGPIRAEAKLGGSVFAEFSRAAGGMSDFGGTLSADVKVGTNLIKKMDGTQVIGEKRPDGKMSGDNSVWLFKDPSVSIVGATAKFSFMTGPSLAGKGFLSGLEWSPK